MAKFLLIILVSRSTCGHEEDTSECEQDLCDALDRISALEAIAKSSVATFIKFKQAVFEQIPALVCPPNYAYYPKAQRCYTFSAETLNWADSKERCSSFASGSQLATILNKEQDDDIMGILKSLNYSDTAFANCRTGRGVFYTGGQRIEASDCNSEFNWKPSGDVQFGMNFTNWPTDEPNCDFDGEACLAYDTVDDSLNYRWNDVDCSNTYCALCEAAPYQY